LNIEIECLKVTAPTSEIEDCLRVLTAVGKNIYSLEHLRAMAVFGIVLFAVYRGFPSGVLTLQQWMPSDSEDANNFLPPGRQLKSDPPGLHLVDCAVLPEYRRQGIGTALVRDALANCIYVTGDGTSHCYSRARTYSRVPLDGMLNGTSYGLLTSLGFVELANIPLCYGANKEWECPDCGEPCTCSGRMMTWERE
jgi:GNAT superfamily N-acetyltransferase